MASPPAPRSLRHRFPSPSGRSRPNPPTSPPLTTPYQVLFSDLIDDPTGKYLKVKLITKNKLTKIAPPYLMDEGAEVTWTPNGDKLTTSAPGVLFKSYQDDWFGEAVSVLEMDGKVDNIDELVSRAARRQRLPSY